MLESNKNRGLIYLIIFSIVCVLITAVLIYLTNEEIITFSKKDTETAMQEEKAKIIPDGLGIKSLKAKYTINSLKTHYEEYHWGEKEYEDAYYPIDVTYIQISGLKDKRIENQINKEIKDTTLAQANREELNKNGTRNIIVSAMCEANFSNVLSVQISKEIIDQNFNSEIQKEIIGLNYDLSTGEKIKFSDLFTNDAGIKNIISKSAYMTFANEYLGNFELVEDNNWDGDMSKIDYSSIEERMFKVLQGYDRENEYSFYFNEKDIYVYINNEQIKIKMKDYYNQIAIYNRYAKKSGLFEDETENKTFVFVLVANAEDYTVYRKVDEIAGNLFVDVELADWTIEGEKNNNSYEEYIKKLTEEIEKCEIYLSKNKDDAIVLGFYEELNYADNGDKAKNDFICRAVMNKDYYKNTYMDKVLEWEQKDANDSDSLSNHLVSFLSEECESNKNIKLEKQFPDGY